MNGVFDTRAGTIYDDDIARRYHFPNRYIQVALAFLGDWIVYREPRRNRGRSGYVAVARVVAIDPDPNDRSSSYARLEGFLNLDRIVPLDGPAGPYETLLKTVPNPSARGRTLQGRSVRPISPEDFAAIVRAGLHATLAPANARRLELDGPGVNADTRGLLDAPPGEQERRIEQILVNRRIRDAAFRGQVMEAYDGRCAVTGIRLINGGGKAEAQPAHIWPVADGGPDIVQNGIALSATVHWLFDRHLISLTDELGLLVAHNRIQEELRGLFAKQMARIIVPKDPALHPHPSFVQRHRELFASK